MENPYKYKGEPIPRIDSRVLIVPTTRGILYTWNHHRYIYSVEVYFSMFNSPKLVYQTRENNAATGFAAYYFNGEVHGKYFGE